MKSNNPAILLLSCLAFLGLFPWGDGRAEPLAYISNYPDNTVSVISANLPKIKVGAMVGAMLGLFAFLLALRNAFSEQKITYIEDTGTVIYRSGMTHGSNKKNFKKIWEVDPLGCPRCGYEMKIITLIHEPDVIARILCHLGLWKQPPDPHEGKIKAPADGPRL